MNLVTGSVWPPRQVIDAPGVNGAARFTKSASGVRINPVEIVAAMRAIETDQGVVLRDIRIDGLVARELQRDGIRFREVHDCEISNFHLSMRGEPQTGDQFPVGITIYAGRNIVLRDGLVEGFRHIDPLGKHNQGDGIGTEGGVEGMRIERVTARNCGDSGFDLKGLIVGVDLVAEGNATAIKVWRDIHIDRLTAINNKRVIHMAKGSKLHIGHLEARSVNPGPVFVFEGNNDLTIDSIDLSGIAPGSRLAQRNGQGGTVTLPAGTPKTFP